MYGDLHILLDGKKCTTKNKIHVTLPLVWQAANKDWQRINQGNGCRSNGSTCFEV